MYEGRIEVLRCFAYPVGRANIFVAQAHIYSNRSGRQPMPRQVRASFSRCRWRLAVTFSHLHRVGNWLLLVQC